MVGLRLLEHVQPLVNLLGQPQRLHELMNCTDPPAGDGPGAVGDLIGRPLLCELGSSLYLRFGASDEGLESLLDLSLFPSESLTNGLLHVYLHIG